MLVCMSCTVAGRSCPCFSIRIVAHLVERRSTRSRTRYRTPYRQPCRVQHGRSPATLGAVGQPLPYTFDVTNTGNVTFTGWVSDYDLVDNVSCPLTTLPPGTSTTLGEQSPDITLEKRAPTGTLAIGGVVVVGSRRRRTLR